ncbi:unnamed protein product [Coffea canephora]|uniref:Uncharacterized protein n=1 Tax=Coffea canephora TaxID=49390 RepID=A0A068UHL9_COFCA|nr:unnamed protein product [Coffea canephora]
MYKKGENGHDLASDVRTDVVNSDVSANDPHKILAVINNPNTPYCHFTSGCKLPFHDVDYGWGKPLSVFAPALPVKNRIILMDAKYGEGIQALVTLADEDMKVPPDELLSLGTIDLSN